MRTAGRAVPTPIMHAFASLHDLKEGKVKKIFFWEVTPPPNLPHTHRPPTLSVDYDNDNDTAAGAASQCWGPCHVRLRPARAAETRTVIDRLGKFVPLQHSTALHLLAQRAAGTSNPSLCTTSSLPPSRHRSLLSRATRVMRDRPIWPSLSSPSTPRLSSAFLSLEILQT